MSTVTITSPTSTVVLNIGRQGPPGADGETFVPAGILVYSDADLPAPVSNVITLTNALYEIMGPIVIPDGVRIVAPSDVAIVGHLPLVSRIVGNVNGPLITFTTQVGTTGGRLERVRVENTNAGASARAWTLSSASGTITAENCQIVCPQGALDFGTIGSFKSIGCSFVSSNAGADTIRFTGISFAVVFEYCSWQCAGANSRLVGMLGGSFVGAFSAIRTGLGMTDASQIAIYKDPVATAPSATIERLVRFAPVGTVNSGWSQATPGWRVLSTDTLPDSSAVVTSYVASTFTQAFGAPATYAPLAPAVGNPWSIDSDSERFEIVSTNTGRVRYVGTSPRKFMIIGSAAMFKSGTTVGAKLAIFVNDVYHPGSDGFGDVSTRTSSHSATPVIHVLNTGDEVSIQVQNADNADPFTVVGGSLAMLAGNVS